MEDCIHCHQSTSEMYEVEEGVAVCVSCYARYYRSSSLSERRREDKGDSDTLSARPPPTSLCAVHQAPITLYDSFTFQPLCSLCLSQAHKHLSASSACQKLTKLLRTHRDKALKLLYKYEHETNAVLERKADACEHLLKGINVIKDTLDQFYNEQLMYINELCDQALHSIKRKGEKLKNVVLECEEMKGNMQKKKVELMGKAVKLIEEEIPVSLSTFNILTQDNVQQLVEIIPEVFLAELTKVEIPLSSNVLYHLSPLDPTVIAFDLATESFINLPAVGVERWPAGARHVMVGEGVMVIVGGRVDGEMVGAVYVFTFVEQRVEQGADMNHVRDDFALVSVGATIYSLSGPTNERYSLESNTWSDLSPIDSTLSPWAVKWLDKIYCTSKSTPRLFIFSPKSEDWLSMELTLNGFTPIYACFLNSESLLVLSQKCKAILTISSDNAVKKDTSLSLDVLADTPLLYQGRIYLMSLSRDGLCFVSSVNLKTMKVEVFS